MNKVAESTLESVAPHQLGRHGPGHNVFCYFFGPENMPVEYTAEMQQVDPNYRTGKPEDWKWPPGRLDHWGTTHGPREAIEMAGLKIDFTDDDELAIARIRERLGIEAGVHDGQVTLAVPEGAQVVPRP